MKSFVIYTYFLLVVRSLFAQTVLVEYDCYPIFLNEENRAMIAASNPEFLKKLDNEYERFELTANLDESKYSFIRLMYKDTSIQIAESSRVYAHVYLDLVHKYIYNVNDSVPAKVGRDTLRSQDWQIVDESKKIAGYLCQKAIRKDARGQKIVVWFTAEIPIKQGPNAFYGLPGLILAVNSKDYTLIAHKVQKRLKPVQLKMPIAPEYMTLKALLDAGRKTIEAAFNMKKK
jgi:GLPGLI family protein